MQRSDEAIVNPHKKDIETKQNMKKEKILKLLKKLIIIMHMQP